MGARQKFMSLLKQSETQKKRTAQKLEELKKLNREQLKKRGASIEAQKAVQEAKMSRISKQAQRKRVKKNVDKFYELTYERMKAEGKDTRVLLERWRNADKVVDRIMETGEKSRLKQKTALGITGLGLTGGAIGVAMGIEEMKHGMPRQGEHAIIAGAAATAASAGLMHSQYIKPRQNIRKEMRHLKRKASLIDKLLGR